MSKAFQNQSTSQVQRRDCRKGYQCGNSCIAKSKVCIKKLAGNRAKEIASRFSDSIKGVQVSKDVDLATDI